VATDKDFKVKNNLIVQSGQVTLGSVPLAFNTDSNKLQIYVENEWREVSDSNDISFMDLGLAIDFDGNPIYTVQANGVETTATKFANGGDPTTTSFTVVFDSGSIA